MKYGLDSTYIIAEQKPYRFITKMYNKTTDKPRLDEFINYFEKSYLHHYWIINKKARYSNVYGPFTKVEFLQKRGELQVPDTITFCIKTPYSRDLWMNRNWWEKKPTIN